MIDVKIKLIDGGKMPEMKTEGAACYDCYANEDVYIPKGSIKTVKLGFAVQIPKGYEMQMRPRSGLSVKGTPAILGTIDSDYRGEVGCILMNFSCSKIPSPDGEDDFSFGFMVHKGDRICQAAIREVPESKFTIVDELDSTDRGEGGFGHTGI